MNAHDRSVRDSIAGSETVASVLLVSPDPDDSSYSRHILLPLGCGLAAVPSWNSAKSSVREGRFGVVISERDLPDGTWLDVQSTVRSLPHPPLLIVASRLADEHLWAEVLNRCGFDVLAKQFVRDEISRVIGYALDAWNRSIPKRPARSVESGKHKLRASAGFTARI
jgi:DNA-binding NtrC family response regulator